MNVPSVPQLVLYGLAVLVVIAFVFAASTSTAAFGAYNLEWDGTADARELAAAETESVIAVDTEPYETAEPSGTVAVVLAPERVYEPDDAERVRQFVANGGTLLVADNFGPTETADPYGNTLLEQVDATARFDGAPLRDERRYYESPALPLAEPVVTHPYTTGVDELTLNYGTAVEPHEAEVLVRTFEFSYLDRDWSGDISESEELTSYPVVTVEEVGDGRVITVGDPSLFINSMLTRPGNAAFVSAVFQSHDRSILDYSANEAQPPLTALVILFRNTPALQALFGLLSIAVVWSISTRRHIYSRMWTQLLQVLPQQLSDPFSTERLPDESVPGMNETELITYLRSQHPEWDEERLQRIVTGIIRERTRQTTDE